MSAPSEDLTKFEELFVDNLSFQCQELDLIHHFEDRGFRLRSISIVRTSGVPRGFAFVSLEDRGKNAEAIEQINDSILFGRRLVVRASKPQNSSRQRSAGKGAERKGAEVTTRRPKGTKPFAAKGLERHQSKHSVYVTNLSLRATEDTIKSLFENNTVVRSLIFNFRQNTKVTSALVTLLEEDCVDTLIAEMEGVLVDDIEIAVKPAYLTDDQLKEEQSYIDTYKKEH